MGGDCELLAGTYKELCSMTIEDQQKALQNLQFTKEGLETFLQAKGKDVPVERRKIIPTTPVATIVARQPIATEIDLDLFNVDEGFVGDYEPDEELVGQYDDNDAMEYQQQLSITDEEYLEACKANSYRTRAQLIKAIKPKITLEAIWEYYPDYKSKKKPKLLPRSKDVLLNNFTREELCVLIAKLDQRGGDLRNYSLFKPHQRRKTKVRFEDVFFEENPNIAL